VVGEPWTSDEALILVVRSQNSFFLGGGDDLQVRPQK
jgi:hypothetical protein